MKWSTNSVSNIFACVCVLHKHFQVGAVEIDRALLPWPWPWPWLSHISRGCPPTLSPI